MCSDPPIPVILLTGFLGSGKTTLVNGLIHQQAMTGTLVIVNEFGEVPLDHLLVVPSRETPVLETSGGCICCTVRHDLARTLRALPHRFAREGRRQFDRVLIETSGLANPAPILHTLSKDAWLRSQYRVASTVTAVDAVNGAATLAVHPESVAQVAAADRLLITKTDLATAAGLSALRSVLASINGGAIPIEVSRGEVPAHHVLDLGCRSGGGTLGEIGRWLNFEAHHAAASNRRFSPATAGERPGMGVEREPVVSDHWIDPAIRTECRVVDAPLAPEAVEEWVGLLTALAGPKLLRMKAIFNVDGHPGPVVLHAVQHVVHPPELLPHWLSDDRRSRIVLITRDLDADVIGSLLAVLPAGPPAR